MGYRRTIITQDASGKLPKWFIEKYKEEFNINELLVSTKYEIKTYGDYFFGDYHKALIECGFFFCPGREMQIVVLGEEGHCSKVIITKEERKYYQMIRELDYTIKLEL